MVPVPSGLDYLLAISLPAILFFLSCLRIGGAGITNTHAQEQGH